MGSSASSQQRLHRHYTSATHGSCDDPDHWVSRHAKRAAASELVAPCGGGLAAAASRVHNAPSPTPTHHSGSRKRISTATESLRLSNPLPGTLGCAAVELGVSTASHAVNKHQQTCPISLPRRKPRSKTICSLSVGHLHASVLCLLTVNSKGTSGEARCHVRGPSREPSVPPRTTREPHTQQQAHHDPYRTTQAIC